VYVRQGKKISTQESVGRISVDEDGNSELHFELWKDKVKLNPEGWLK
jgi:septal ring factor EnvC (AmiA/AmiB activator)